jgi:hypothetical protein
VAAEAVLAQPPQQVRLSHDARAALLLAMPEQTQVCSLLAAVGKSSHVVVALVSQLAVRERYSPAAPVVPALLPGCLQRKALEAPPRPTGRTQNFSQGVP